MTVVSEDSPYCGQSGRVRRVFWRQRTAWVLVRLRLGGMATLPWASTDLPVPHLEDDTRPDEVSSDPPVSGRPAGPGPFPSVTVHDGSKRVKPIQCLNVLGYSQG